MTRKEFRMAVAADSTTPRNRSRTVQAKRATKQRNNDRRNKLTMREGF